MKYYVCPLIHYKNLILVDDPVHCSDTLNKAEIYIMNEAFSYDSEYDDYCIIPRYNEFEKKL